MKIYGRHRLLMGSHPMYVRQSHDVVLTRRVIKTLYCIHFKSLFLMQVACIEEQGCRMCSQVNYYKGVTNRGCGPRLFMCLNRHVGIKRMKKWHTSGRMEAVTERPGNVLLTLASTKDLIGHVWSIVRFPINGMTQSSSMF